MTANPYQPSPIPPAEPTVAARRGRPTGISILAVLHVLGGIGIAALGVFLAVHFDEEDWTSAISWSVVIAAPLLAMASSATAIGLWRGRKWAWWLATFYYFQFAIGGVVVLGIIPISVVFLDRPVTERTVELLVKHIGRLPIFLLLNWYMTRSTVLAYFQFQRLTRLRALGILTGVVVLGAVVVALLIAVVAIMVARLG